MLDWMATAKEDERAIMMQTLYQIWLARNEARDWETMGEARMIADNVNYYLQEWQKANPLLSPKQSPPKENWQAPEVGWFKVNVDGSLLKHMDKGGAGAVIRDHHGRFHAGTCHFFPIATEPELVELLACKRAVNLAKEMGISKLVLESDCKELVTKISSKEKDLSQYGPLVEEIKSLLLPIQEVEIRWGCRSANSVAHNLPRVGKVAVLSYVKRGFISLLSQND